uniref:Complex I assembly factor TIMMDC1, mitochondrial n=1 Tax=Phlebotomus papatasi TaxID=29031 RepID=A0A1B0GMI0_PHLPP
MLRKLVKHAPVVAFIPMVFDKPDEVSKDTKTAKDFLTRQVDDETGMDRLKKMFTMNSEDGVSSELTSIQQAGFMGIFVGACYGGFLHSRKAYLDFMERNLATSFSSHLDAKKKLQHAVTMSFAKGAFRWGWRLGLFTSTYVGFITMVSVYRGKSSIYEYILAGTAAGAMYKMNLGLRGMVAGGAVGCALGTVGGLLSVTLLRATGMSMEEVRYWQYKWKVDRQTMIQANLPSSANAEKDPILEAHEERFGKGIHTLTQLDEKPTTQAPTQKNEK